MMGNLRLFFCIFAGLLAIITVIIGVKQPELSKQAIFSDEYHQFAEIDTKPSNVDFSNHELSKSVSYNTAFPKSKPVKKIIKQIIRYEEPRKTEQNNPLPPRKTIPPPGHKTLPSVKEAKKLETVVLDTRQIKQPNVENVESKNPNTQKILSESDEIIAWNIWRSNLQNQVMIDSKLRAPLGTVFKFSFTVDKYGNMSNIKVWSTNPSFTGLAVSVIKPVLTSYAHTSILNFPYGTKRVITNVTGGFVISVKTKYSSPSDYSDYEKIKRRY